MFARACSLRALIVLYRRERRRQRLRFVTNRTISSDQKARDRIVSFLVGTISLTID